MQQHFPINSTINDHKGVLRVELTFLNLFNLLIFPGHYFGVILSGNVCEWILLQLEQVAELIDVIVGLISFRNIDRKSEHVHRLDIFSTESECLGSFEIELLIFLHR